MVSMATGKRAARIENLCLFMPQTPQLFGSTIVASSNRSGMFRRLGSGRRTIKHHASRPCGHDSTRGVPGEPWGRFTGRKRLMSELDSRQIDEINALLAVAESKSFVGAGRLVQRDPSIISKRIIAFEKRLGVRLLERTTRQVRLTEIGATLVERLRGARDLIAEAVQDASSGATQLRGKSRLAFPGAMGRLWIGPMLSEFLALQPMLIVEVRRPDLRGL